jgi:hypothetical protein
MLMEYRCAMRKRMRSFVKSGPVVLDEQPVSVHILSAMTRVTFCPGPLTRGDYLPIAPDARQRVLLRFNVGGKRAASTQLDASPASSKDES